MVVEVRLKQVYGGEPIFAFFFFAAFVVRGTWPRPAALAEIPENLNRHPGA